MTQAQTFQFKFVVLPESGQWVAQCLNFDVAAQGDTILEARESLAKTLAQHIVLALHNNEQPFAGIPTAPPEDRERFKSGQRLADPQPIFVPQDCGVNAMADDVRIAA